ncbi:MAG: VWA domain-containing protein, partial [Anaerolineae bacterium]|nr:VWA domain-containing protein [Anaerolineae bacterium]
SMEVSDPHGLRFIGARLFLSLLDIGDSAAVVIFSTDSKALKDTVTTIQSYGDKTALLKEIQNEAPDGFTDIRSAFLSARDLIQHSGLHGLAAYIVLLTDGKPDVPNMSIGYEDETLQLAKSLNVPVISIALTPSAQTPFLDRLANETKGRVVPANHAADLLDAYLSILGQIKDRTILSASPNDLSFFLDPALTPYVNSASFILSRSVNSPAFLYSPGRKSVQANDQDVSFYFEDPGFMAISLNNPSPGKWTFQGSTNGEFKAYAILHSRLRVEMDAPGAYHQQSKPMVIAVRMMEELADGSRLQIIGDATFTAVVTLPDGTQESMDLFYDDGSHGDVETGDGIFSRRYVNTDQLGTYTIEIHGHKSDVPVEYLAKVEVIAFPEMILQEPVGQHEFHGEPLQVTVLLKDANHFPLEHGEIVASITAPSGAIQVLQLIQKGETYSSDFSPNEEGIYQIQITGEDAVYRGLPYQERVSSQVEVKFVRTLNLAAAKWTATSCFDPRGNVPVHVRVFSPEPETIQFDVGGADGLQSYPASIRTAGGLQEFTLQITTPSGTLPPGNYQFHLKPTSSVTFEDQSLLPNFSLEVPTVYQRCNSVFKWGGLSSFALVVMAVLVARKLRQDTMPALLTGTLRYWQESGSLSSLVLEHNLNSFSKTAVLVGSAADCDIPISDHGLEPQHFSLIAEKKDDGTQIILKPLGEIRKGYSQLHTLVVLRHGDMFRIRDLNFQYLSDSGE